MAETVGLALGVVSLAGLFSAFFDAAERIRQLKGVRGDVKETVEVVDIETKRLIWIRDKYNMNQLKAAEPMLEVMMNHINKEIEAIISVIDKYTSRSLSEAQDKPRSSAREWTNPKALVRQVAWITKDKTEVAGRLSTLHGWVDSLWNLATSESEQLARKYFLRAEIVSASDNENLQSLESLDLDLYRDISKAARVKRLLMHSQETSTVNTSAHANRKYSEWAAEREVGNPAHFVPFESMQWQRSDDQDSGTEGLWSIGKCRLSASGQLDVPILVEWRSAFTDGGQSRSATEARLDGLHDLLHAMYTAEGGGPDLVSRSEARREVEFGVLECLGWTSRTSVNRDRLGLVFRLPTQKQHLRPPKTLHAVIELARQQKRDVPPLGYRFDMAFGVASAVANILAVGWRHRAVRSENMLSFENQSSRLFLVGFTYSRSDDASHEFSNLPQRPDWEHYRPLKADAREAEGGDGSEGRDAEGSAATDMYGLGVVLVEIGLWRTARSLGKDAVQFRTSRMREFLGQLAPRCGSIYCDVVRKCLDGHHWGSETLKENLADLLADLKSCHA
ncbi:hypothetical protein F5Y10DRAFT_248410 [Nemania abortiva]|nr:hypothetical protein F5Y10DRAFT_248410 [Nemania abortiva]